MTSPPDRAHTFRRLARRLGRSSTSEEERDVGRGFEVRHFAGPEAYVDALDTPVRVAHLTDQHFGRVTPHAAQKEAIQHVNAAQPDLVVITGDFVAHSLDHLDELEHLIGAIEAPVFCVLGNHDHWTGPDEIRQALRRAGAEVLDNAHTIVEPGPGRRLQVVGLDDAYTGHADREEALKGLRSDLPVLGLSHIGEEADGLWAGGVPLVLAGHTHAGQVTLARLHELTLGRMAGHRYVHGLYGSRDVERPQEGTIYVGAGVGAAVVPLRMGERAKREVTIFELGAPPGTFDEHHDEQDPHPGRAPSERKQAKRIRQLHRRRAKHAKRHARRMRHRKHAPRR